MAELNTREKAEKVETEQEKNLDRLDEELNIMERHAGELAEAEEDIQESMRKRDREHKDASLHSVPRHRKHMR